MKKYLNIINDKDNIFSIILKVVGSSVFLTIINYSINLYGLSVLGENVIGTIIFIQSYLVIGLQVGMSGYNYEILRFGNIEEYNETKFGLNKRVFLKIALITLFYVFISWSFVNSINGSLMFLIFIPIIILIVFIILSCAVLRSMQEYLLSNILDKFIVTSTSIIILISSFYSMTVNEMILVYLIMSVLVFLICLFVINQKVPIRNLYSAEKNDNDPKIRNNLYLGSILILIVFEIQNIFIGENISLEDLSLWNAYLLLFFPFRFLARNVHQILFPELASERFSFTKKIIIRYLIVVLLMSTAIYLIGVFPYQYYYQGKYDMNSLGILLIVALGFFHMIYSPIGVYLGARCPSNILFLNNIYSLIIALAIISFYYFNISLNFPFLLIAVLASYWFFKCIIGLLLIRKELYLQ